MKIVGQLLERIMQSKERNSEGCKRERSPPFVGPQLTRKDDRKKKKKKVKRKGRERHTTVKRDIIELMEEEERGGDGDGKKREREGEGEKMKLAMRRTARRDRAGNSSRHRAND